MGVPIAGRLTSTWSHFVDVVDEVIPLASGAKQVAGVTVS